MIIVSVMYPNSKGSRFDMKYYVERHIPMVQEKLGTAVKAVAVEEGIAGAEPGSAPPYCVIGHLSFESVAAFQASFGPHAQGIMADIPNYTDIRPTIQVSEQRL